MPIVRKRKRFCLDVEGSRYEVSVVETPFREGIELVCQLNGEELRVSDRQLGEHEAERLLIEEIKRRAPSTRAKKSPAV